MSVARGNADVSVMLRPAVRTTSVKKDSVGTIQHEPFKCAIGRQTASSSNHAFASLPSSRKREGRHFNNNLPMVNQMDRDVPDERCVMRKPSSTPIGTVVPMPNTSVSQNVGYSTKAHQKPGETINYKPPDLFSVSQYIGSAVHFNHSVSDLGVSTGSESITGSLAQSATVVSSSSASARDETLSRLEGEVIYLKDQLEVQFKVNTDLKKLLVASIGDDLHHKVDALVRTKIQLANEIDDYTKKLVEDYEDLDKMSIQADIWHSKFKASRLLVDQLNADKNRLSGAFCEAQTALQCILSEHRELRQHLLYCQRDLESVLHVVRSSSSVASTKLSTDDLHTLGLARHVKRLVDELRVATKGAATNKTPPKATLECLTTAELLAHKVLVTGSHVKTANYNPSFGRVQSFPLLQQLHPHARFDDVTFNCCTHCKGEVRIV